MVKIDKYSVDELVNGMRYAARSIVRRCKNTFEVDELVNEAWIAGVNSNLPTKYQRLKRAKWDMEHYVRTRLGRKIVVKGEEVDRPVFFTNTECYENYSIDKKLDELENRDLIDFIINRDRISSLNDRDITLIELYFLKSKSLKEAAAEVEVSESRASVLVKEALKKCRREAEKTLGEN